MIHADVEVALNKDNEIIIIDSTYYAKSLLQITKHLDKRKRLDEIVGYHIKAFKPISNFIYEECVVNLMEE